MNWIAFLVALLLAVPAAIAEEKTHPIDGKVEALFEKAGSTAEMIEACDAAAKLWDAELNRCYGELKKKLRPAAWTALQAAQRQWLAYRDAQWKCIAEFYGQFEGTMYLPMRADAAMSIVRTRAMELHDMLAVFEEHGG